MTAAQIIADNLAAIPHPDGAPRQLAGYNTTLLPEALREQVTTAAREVGESIVHLLELNGYRIVREADIPAPAGDAGDPSIANLHCVMCDERLLSISLVNPTHAVTNGRILLQGLGAREVECPHGAVGK